VLTEVLGLSATELKALEEKEIIGTVALPPRPKKKAAAQNAAE
jgi:hypothetical protein